MCILRYIMDSQESLKVGDSIWDFDWDLNRSVEFRSPFTRKEILSPGSNSSNSSMIDNQRRNEIKKIKLKNQDRIRVGTEIVIDLK